MVRHWGRFHAFVVLVALLFHACAGSGMRGTSHFDHVIVVSDRVLTMDQHQASIPSLNTGFQVLMRHTRFLNLRMPFSAFSHTPLSGAWRWKR